MRTRPSIFKISSIFNAKCLAAAGTNTRAITIAPALMALQHQNYAVKTQNWEKREAKFDFTPIKEKIWPELPPLPTDYRNYVPSEEADEDDDWKPDEEYPEPGAFIEDSRPPKPFPVITPVFRPCKVNEKTGIVHSSGKRKTSIALVYLKPGSG